tara:strand:- start:12026 stop:12379 length:354 start_codon:yes stop_codon:yes gene_type:complete
MTQERYFKMCEQMDKEPIEDEIPPDIGDFPEIAVSALEVFANLGNRIYADVGFTGKDYTNLPIYLQIYKVPKKDTELFLEILLYLERYAIESSQDSLKREREKIKRKSSGRHNNPKV